MVTEDETPKTGNEAAQEPEKILVSGTNQTVTPEGVNPNEPAAACKMTPNYKLVTRMEWGATDPTRLNPFRGPARGVRLIFTDGKCCRTKKTCIKVVKKLQISHMRQGLSDIAYNFLVGSDLRAYEGRGWKEHPGVTESTENFRTCEDIVIAYLGTFDDNMEYPEMGDVAHELLDYGYSCGYMTGDYTSTGGQEPSDSFANTGIDFRPCPDSIRDTAYGVGGMYY